MRWGIVIVVNLAVILKLHGIHHHHNQVLFVVTPVQWQDMPTLKVRQQDQSGSICADTAVVPRAPQRKVSSVAGRGQGATGRGQGAAGRGKGCSGRVGGSGSGQFDADRGGTSSERVLYGGINLRNASPTNINIGFKPSGLKWNEKDAVTSTQLQQMKANKRKKVETTKSSSSIGSSKK
ncbi:hypothetical protein BC332_27176 [Capsicum chinense]|nr:hypothetical protein BC332_27176 [Capsicum chinense]